MRLRYNQLVLMDLLEEEIQDVETQKEVCQALKERNIIFGATISRGSPVRYEKLRITAVHDGGVDLIAIDGSSTMTMRNIGFSSIASISITAREPISKEELKEITFENVIGLSL